MIFGDHSDDTQADATVIAPLETASLSASAEDGESLADEAGAECSQCGETLPADQDFTLCDECAGRCPYCGAAPLDECEHILFERGDGQWSSLDLDPPHLPDEFYGEWWSEERPAEAFGDAVPLLDAYHGDLTEPPDERDLIETIVERLATPVVSRSWEVDGLGPVTWSGTRSFTPDMRDAREEIGAAMRRLRERFDALAASLQTGPTCAECGVPIAPADDDPIDATCAACGTWQCLACGTTDASGCAHLLIWNADYNDGPFADIPTLPGGDAGTGWSEAQLAAAFGDAVPLLDAYDGDLASAPSQASLLDAIAELDRLPVERRTEDSGGPGSAFLSYWTPDPDAVRAALQRRLAHLRQGFERLAEMPPSGDR